MVAFDINAFCTTSRRRFMTGLVSSAAALAWTGDVWANPVFRMYPFSLGVASGDPSPDGFVIWTRLAPEPFDGGGMPNRIVEVNWEVARDAAFKTVVAKGLEPARPELGHSVHVEVAGLEPAREYFYRFVAGSERSRIGRARTLPPLGSPSTASNSASQAVSAMMTASSPPTSIWRRRTSTSCFTTVTTSMNTVS